MSVQVGSHCYADLVAAAGAACAAHVPTTTIVGTSGTSAVTLSCAGVTSTGKLQMALSMSAPPPSAAPSTGCTAVWKITQSGADANAMGTEQSFGEPAGACAAAASFHSSYGTPGPCAITGDTLQIHVAYPNVSVDYVWARQGCTAGTSSTTSTTASTTTIRETEPSFAPCMQGDVLEAGTTVGLAILTAAVPIWGTYRIIKMLRWGRGEAA
jgi:hypothetical protein